MKTIDSLHKIRNSQYFRGFEGVDGPTPIWLCESQIDKIPCDYSDPNVKWLIPAAGHGTHGIILYWRYMKGLSKIFIDNEERSGHILKNMLYLNEINPWLCRQLRKQGFINVIEGDYFECKTEMNFDCIVGNPAWHFLKPGYKKTQAIWHKFVDQSLELVKENGFISLIHPTGWRDIDSDFDEIKQKMLKYKIHFLSLNSESESQKTFNVQSCFDWYVLQKTEVNRDFLTQIKMMDGTLTNRKLYGSKFIANGEYGLIDKLMAKTSEGCVELIHSYSDYETRKRWMNKIQSEEFNFPCVSNVNKDGSLSLYYSNKNTKGHFGIPKLICGKASSGTNFYIDEIGEYALTQYAFAIVDTLENLPKIKSALESSKFKKLSLSLPRYSQAINYKMLSYFKKDFWKEFIDE